MYKDLIRSVGLAEYAKCHQNDKEDGDVVYGVVNQTNCLNHEKEYKEDTFALHFFLDEGSVEIDFIDDVHCQSTDSS